MSAENNFKYPQCSKGDYHTGQLLNLVCLEPKCIQKSIICGICYDNEHKNHKIKPLKLIISQSKKYLQHLTPINIDTNKVKKSIEVTKMKLLQNYQTFEKYVSQSLSTIKNTINAVFIKILDQIDLKTGNNEEMVKVLQQIKTNEINQQRFISLMKKLLTGVPIQQVQQDDIEPTGLEIEESIFHIQEKIQKDLNKKKQKIKHQFESYLQLLQKTMDNPGIFQNKLQFKFSTEFKHGGVKVINDNLIKSTQAYNYHFGLLQPSIMEKGNKPFNVAFKINQNISNWLAVGICYKNTVQANSYQFNYSTLGHGAYMISCNAGSWSSIDSSKNNVVNSFHFAKDDIIIINYEPDNNQVTFKKKGSNDTHVIEFEVKEDDQLHLCGLFYYNNDEIEFLGNYDE